MQRWGISESRLPPGSEIYFRNPTVWEQYKTQITAVGAALVLQTMLVAWLLYERRRRQLSEAVARETMSELAHVNRVATAGELSASIVHEVTQPLTGIVATANAALRWLSGSTPNVEKARAAMTQIADAGHRTAEVVRSVRAAFQHEASERRPINMNDLVLRVLALVKAELAKHDIETRTALDRELPSITGDEIQMQQVLLNLIMNAFDSMRARERRPRRLGVRSGLSKGESVLVSIEDNGKGIAEKDLDRLFKPLFTTKSNGMGMGLSICRTIVEAHHGHIWAEPNDGHGAVFRISLPAAPSDA
jgi:signal transduction histidine kinase